MALRDVLLITYHFPPSAASGTFRMLGLARHLPKFGWRPVVVAPESLPWEPVDLDLLKELPPEVVVHRAPYPAGVLAKLGRRLLGPEPVWLPRAWWECRKVLRQHAVKAVLTSGPPHPVHLVGLRVQRSGVPLVADFRDPWLPLGPVGPEWAKSTYWRRRGERKVMAEAAGVVLNAPLAAHFLGQVYPAAVPRFATITNGFDPERFPRVPPPCLAGPGAPVTVVHPGEFYVGRDPRTFLDALALARQEPGSLPRPVRATFLGRNTGGKFDLATEVAQRGLLDVVHQGGQVPYARSLRDMTAGDILLLLDGKGRRIGAPAKLYEYLGAGRPILALAEPDSDTAWVLRESGVPHRLIPPPGDGPSIRAALADLIGELQAGNYAAPPERLERFTREGMARQMAGVLDRVAGGAR